MTQFLEVSTNSQRWEKRKREETGRSRILIFAFPVAAICVGSLDTGAPVQYGRYVPSTAGRIHTNWRLLAIFGNRGSTQKVKSKDSADCSSLHFHIYIQP